MAPRTPWSSEIFDKLLDLPVDRVVAGARVALALTALFAVWVDPTEPASNARAVFMLLGTYAGISSLVALLPLARAKPLALVTHGGDIALSSALMYLTAGPSSPFFPFFVFIIVAGLLRWDWIGAIGSAGLLAVVLVLLTLTGNGPTITLEESDLDIGRSVIRGGF